MVGAAGQHGPLALAVAIVAQLEVAAVTHTLPAWAYDGRSVWHVRRHLR